MVESLLVNDREEVYNGKEALIEPKDAIEELVRRKGSAIPALIPLIERYEKEKERRNYVDYVIETLGRIGSERALELITRILLATIANDDDGSDTCLSWLRNNGRVAVPALLRFMEANYQDTIAVGYAAEAMETIRDRRLVPMSVKLLDYPNPLVVQSALLSLETQGDKSVVPHIIPLRDYKHEHPGEQRQTREFASRALGSLLGEEQPEPREVESKPKSRPRSRAPRSR